MTIAAGTGTYSGRTRTTMPTPRRLQRHFTWGHRRTLSQSSVRRECRSR